MKGGWKSVRQLENRVQDYFSLCDEENKPYTLAGICVHLGISREKAKKYLACEYDTENARFSEVLRLAFLKVEAYAEENLFSAKSATGTIFSLRNNFGWIDKREQAEDTEEGLDVTIEVI